MRLEDRVAEVGRGAREVRAIAAVGDRRQRRRGAAQELPGAGARAAQVLAGVEVRDALHIRVGGERRPGAEDRVREVGRHVALVERVEPLRGGEDRERRLPRRDRVRAPAARAGRGGALREVLGRDAHPLHVGEAPERGERRSHRQARRLAGGRAGARAVGDHVVAELVAGRDELVAAVVRRLRERGGRQGSEQRRGDQHPLSGSSPHLLTVNSSGSNCKDEARWPRCPMLC